MFIGSTAAWRKDLSGASLLGLKRQMRQITSSTFPAQVSDTWVSPSSRPGFDPATWKSDPGFLDEDEIAFVTKIDARECQDEISSAPLELVQARMQQANQLLGHNFSAEDSLAGSEIIDGCYLIDLRWKHIDSFTLLKDGQPWVLKLTDATSGESASIPMIACVMHECSLDDCN